MNYNKASGYMCPEANDVLRPKHATTMSQANAQTTGTGGGIGPAGLKHDTHQKSEP